jgi:hypothetical protein
LRIGEADFLIPRESEMETGHADASRTRSVTTFSACHEYTAESTIHFEGDGRASAETRPAQARASALPAGLSLALKFESKWLTVK